MPVVVEVILERVTNISMGTEIDNVTEFEELAESGEDAPTALYRQPGLRSPPSRLTPRVLLAPDKFKGTLTAAEVAGHVAAGHARRSRPDVEMVVVPVADGGDGTARRGRRGRLHPGPGARPPARPA